jgi:type II secretory pathway pseudopilin PulG
MKPNQLRPKNRKGFALIVTLILLMLITVIAIGLLSLSSTSLRASGTALARSQAQANARMALSLAIGQLQATAGLDQRITASADILSQSSTAPSDPHKGWFGVWQSDEATPSAFPAGRPDRFVDWLVTSSGQNGNARLGEMASSSGDSTVIRSINGITDGEVQIPLIETLENGRLGWWTEDESTKARANLARITSTEIGDKLVALHGSARPQPEGLTSEITGFDPTASETAALVTPAQLPLAATQWPDGASKDFTTYAKSLIVNVKDGGFKKDLTTLFELPYDNIPKDKYGYWYGNSPRNTIEDPNSYIYGAPQVTVGARWNMMYNYYNLYKEISVAAGGVPSITPKPNLVSWMVTTGPIPNSPPELMGDQLAGYRTPRVSQIAYSFCYWVQTTTGGYVPHVGFRTYVSLWNPFDTAINFPSTASFGAKIYPDVPIQFSATTTPSGASLAATDAKSLIGAGSGAGIRRFSGPGTGSSTLSLAPGENAIFSYNLSNGLYTKGFDPGPNAILHSATIPSLQVGAAQRSSRINFSVEGKEGVAPPTGGGGSNSNFSQYSDIWIQALSGGGYEKRGDLVTINTTNFKSMMPRITMNGSRSYLQLQQSGEKVELATFVVKTKAIKEKAASSTLLSAPNLHTGITRMSSLMAGTQVDALTGLYEYAMDLGVNGRDLIGAASGDQQSYIGYAQTSGINHYAPISLPKVPLTSIAQFRHAGLGDGAPLVSANMGNGKTLIPSYVYTGDFAPGPHADQSIGNSYAHPLIPRGQTETNGPYSFKYYDHRYLGNEALWDDYFLSSLAPRDSKFGAAKSASDTWKELQSGEGKLINPRFSAYFSGETSEESDADLFNGSTLRNDAYEKIAAKLMFEGGFNVNSTSVRAWRAMLSSTRGDALMRATGGGEIVNPNKAFYSRTEFVRTEGVDDQPGDYERHFNGFRELDDAQITALAESIVEQVRLRGPFLNVAQFINRRLDGEDRLTLAGPLQTAIDESGLNDSIEESGMRPDTISGLAYPVAAREPNTTAVGIPGWLMQGDILDPLGPSVVVRGDTFRIRAYGEARSPSNEVLSRAWCEAVVQRVPNYVDASEPSYSTPTKTVNESFGRRFEIVQFRWLSGPDDI